MVNAVHNSRFRRSLLHAVTVAMLVTGCTIADPGPRPQQATGSDIDATSSDVAIGNDTSASDAAPTAPDTVDVEATADASTEDSEVSVPQDSTPSPEDTGSIDDAATGETTDTAPAQPDAADTQDADVATTD